MNKPLTELQQFFGAYFNQDWAEDHSSADEVIDTFLFDSTRETIITVKQEILELKNSYTTEEEFQEDLFHKQYCCYYYPYQWTSGLLWLDHIVKKFEEYLLKEDKKLEKR
ncbi:hypothetical protein BFW88_12215 [Pseudomonas fluorescens]|uniref:CdiI immunity protein domain-containing protein n=1 Tax=Pseudomonas lactucae TaxID=2813360 RepID=A0A9X1C686_9PSED|nr:contact-dependent growth inhibition system immunity protein [Pseudomonas lactucae]OPA92333.1 hypothetical protein BFW88_12215 [Pseudomonas fluorescens]MBN2976567.1 hypothetical protein [Pseudomonas lactucae]MBN2988678.1 hypothetical protein [Pseudomonas lactucae]OPB10983.1 hypothetical protein BFW92_12180 [Pseudomonas fluorescens]OPB22264.1 hypothetical protein BFW93_12200 [Pseudomonas fluorescens]